MGNEVTKFIKEHPEFELKPLDKIDREYFIGEYNGEYLVRSLYNKNNNNVFLLGPNGSMKHRSVIACDLYNSIKSKESLFIVDPNYSTYGFLREKLEQNGYDVKIIDMTFQINENDQISPCRVKWNCLDAIKDDPENALRIASNIISNTSNGRIDRFYSYAEQCLLAAVMIYVVRSDKIDDKNKNLFGVLHILNECTEKGLDWLFELYKVEEAYKYYELYKLETEMVDNGLILDCLKRRFSFLPRNNVVSEFLSETTFDFGDLLKKPSAFFLVISKENIGYHFIWDLFVTELIESIKKIPENERKTALNMILDYFSYLGKIGENQDGEDFIRFLKENCERPVRTTIVAESIVGMRMKYPGHFWHDIVTACPLKLVTGVRDQTSAMYVARKTKNYDFEDLLCLSNKKLLVFYKNSNILINKAVF